MKKTVTATHRFPSRTERTTRIVFAILFGLIGVGLAPAPAAHALSAASDSTRSSTVYSGINPGQYDDDGNMVVYDDALTRNWLNWSWGYVDTAYTANTHSGAHAFCMDLDYWQGASIFFSNEQDWSQPGYTGLVTTEFDRLSFWVQRGQSAGGQSIGLQASDVITSWDWRHRYQFTVPTDDAWHEIVVPLSELDAVDTRISRLVWVGNGKETQAILIDDIRLLRAPSNMAVERDPVDDSGDVKWLYRDERNANLASSWNSEVRLQNGIASHGAFGLAVRFRWQGGLEFRSFESTYNQLRPFDLGNTNTLVFNLNRGSQDLSTQNYDIYGKASDGSLVFHAPLQQFIAGGAFDLDPSTWQQVALPVDRLAGGDGQVYAFGIQETDGVMDWTGDFIYLDEVHFAYVPPAPPVIVYTNTVSSSWNITGSWNISVDVNSPAPGLTGTGSIAVTPTAAYAGLYLHSEAAIDTLSYHALRFRVSGGAAGGQRIQVWAHDASYSETQHIVLPPLSTAWTEVEIPLRDLGNPASLHALVWQDSSGSAQPAFYLDEIELSPIESQTPPPMTAIDLRVNASADQHPISPDIYGMNFVGEDLAADLRLPVRRWGGNATTRYNWQLDVSNRGSDWFFENIPNDSADTAQLPSGSSADQFVEQNQRTGARTLLTVPLIGYTPKNRDITCGFSVAAYGAQQSTDAWRSDCGNGVRPDGTTIPGNSPLDTSIAITPGFVHDWITHLKSQFGPADQGGVAYYNLDNEPMLWNYTHRDVHPNPASYDEVRDRTYQVAAAVKQADPTAQTLGPTVWGWTAYFFSALDAAGSGEWWKNPQDRNAHGGTAFVPWYLQQMKAYQDAHGVRILDYLDLHYYPQASNVALKPAGDAATQDLRLRSTRALWDTTYTDESWIAEPVKLLPLMKQWVADNYPGTKLALTEYNWGALNHINGALAQADVLGIFGREGLDLATLWAPPGYAEPGAFAFRMYRNYDGQGSAFGETSVQAASGDQDKLAVYAARRTSDNALTIIVVNKTKLATSSSLSLSGMLPGSAAQMYTYSAADTAQINRQPDQAIAANGLNVVFPAQSITLLVIPSTPLHMTFIPIAFGTPSH